MKLDKIDRKILLALDEDARQSLSKIARTIKLGNDLVEYRVNRMINAEIINSFSALTDFSKLGINIYKTYVRFKNKPKTINKFINYLNNHSQLYWLSEWYGYRNILFSIAADSPQKFKQILDEIFFKFSDCILSFETAIICSVSRFSKGYLLGQPGIKLTYADSDSKISLKELDIKLLHELSSNCRRSYKLYADKLDCTESVIRYSLKKLEQEKVIIGYRMQLNYSKLSMLVVKLLIEPSNINRNFYKDLEEFCFKNQWVTCLIKQLGKYSFEVELEVPSYQIFNSFIDELNNIFDSSINAIEQLFLRKDYFHRIKFQLTSPSSSSRFS